MRPENPSDECKKEETFLSESNLSKGISLKWLHSRLIHGENYEIEKDELDISLLFGVLEVSLEQATYFFFINSPEW